MLNYIKLGGRKRPIKFGFNSIRMFCLETGRTLESLGNELTLDDTLELINCGLISGAAATGEEYHGDKEALCDELDENPESYGKALEAYTQALGNLFAPPSKKTRGATA